MRKHKIVEITAEGRDQGKKFLIVEKSAFETEKWAARAISALSRTGVGVDDELIASGAIGLVVVGLEALKQLPFEDLEPLMDDMMTCVSFVPDTKQVLENGRPYSRRLDLGDDEDDGDICEVATIFKLREEVLELHLGFSVTAALSTMAAAVTSRRQAMQTSPEPSGQPSPQAKPA